MVSPRRRSVGYEAKRKYVDLEGMMNKITKLGLSFAATILVSQMAYAETLNVATVNNDDMIVMQKLQASGSRRPATS